MLCFRGYKDNQDFVTISVQHSTKDHNHCNKSRKRSNITRIEKENM